MKATTKWSLPAVVAIASLSVLATFGGGDSRSEPADAGGVPLAEHPDWKRVFGADGTVRPLAQKRLQRGTDAVFVEDRLSGGAIVDISALDRASREADSFVYNGPVAAPHDLGNAYVLARVEGIDLMLDVRVERLVGGAGSESYVEIEFNHDIVGVTSGHRLPILDQAGDASPGYTLQWPFRGKRAAGDFLVRASLVGSTVSAVEFKSWGEVDGILGYHTLEAGANLADETCFGVSSFYSICGGSLPRDGNGPTYIANGDPEQTYAPDSYLEFSVNVGRLTGLNPEFTTVQVSSPDDIAFGTFRAFGQFASQASDTDSSATGRRSDEK